MRPRNASRFACVSRMMRLALLAAQAVSAAAYVAVVFESLMQPSALFHVLGAMHMACVMFVHGAKIHK